MLIRMRPGTAPSFQLERMKERPAVPVVLEVAEWAVLVAEWEVLVAEWVVLVVLVV